MIIDSFGERFEIEISIIYAMSVFTAIKKHLITYFEKFMKGLVKIFSGLPKTLMRY